METQSEQSGAANSSRSKRDRLTTQAAAWSWINAGQATSRYQKNKNVNLIVALENKSGLEQSDGSINWAAMPSLKPQH